MSEFLSGFLVGVGLAVLAVWLPSIIGVVGRFLAWVKALRVLRRESHKRPGPVPRAQG